MGVADLDLEDKLTRLMNEGSISHVDVTAAGAVAALGLMFLKTNNKSIAAALAIPGTNALQGS
jgi:hypothetical protein